ncbi:MAG: hypothetical protein GU347_05915 [Desulfurococcales archaeon]|jgi:UDP-N-acetylmuramyl pentapeptide phosphotransferase/UDP-N-acetylglucosamine-1-phosphate transferase|nr:hypothetical protein [Desulfurococcales archaeon]
MITMDYPILLTSALSPFITYSSTIAIEKLETRIGLVGEDMHKSPGRFLPKSGGLGFLIGWSISVLLLIASYRAWEGEAFKYEGDLLLALGLVWISGLIGLYDDFKRLGGIEKVLLTALPGIILALSSEYSPFVYIPFLGNVRMSIVYPIALSLAFAISSNGINMSDTFTGIAPGVTAILSASMIITMYLTRIAYPYWGGDLGPSIPLLFTALFSLLGYIPRNFYPGRTFNGDVGSLAWGSLLALGAIWGKVEFFLILSAMPIIANGFTILASIRGIIEHHSLKERPTIANREKNSLRANPNKSAPITLAHMLTLIDELCEKEIVIAVYILVSITSLLSIAIAVLLF